MGPFRSRITTLPTHNGFKMVMNGRSFLAKISNNLVNERGGVIPVDGGKLTQTAVFDAYVNRLLQQADAGDLSVVWDCGNGAAGPATTAIAEKLSGTHQVLFADIDGHFPIPPNPVDPATLDILRRAVARPGRRWYWV